jgi:hypothetical protein
MHLFHISELDKMFTASLRRLETIPADDPQLNETSWFEMQPCSRIKLGSKSVVITQPSSTFWVYLLGLLTIAAGLYFFQTQGSEVSRHLWGWSLLLWGVGALLAGTSYQAFGFQLKCQGRPRAIWTSWWEVIYLIFQQVSMNVMLVAVAYSCTDGWLRAALVIYAAVCSLAYIAITVYGALMPMKSLITFELMVQVSTPIVLFLIGLNSWRYTALGEAQDLALLGCWIGLVLSMEAYWVYAKLGLTEKLWRNGHWFSENDVLHVTLIVWVIYIVAVMGPWVSDLTAA